MSQSLPGKVAVVAGAAGGLGQALGQALAAHPDYATVVALSRARPSSEDGVEWLRTDTTNPADLETAAARVAELTDRVHLLLCCSGVLHGGVEGGLRPEKALAELELENLELAVRVNAFAPLASIRAFRALLRHDQNPVAAVLSAMVGSIGDNSLGGWYSYRMSKAALNMGVRNAAIELGRQRNGPCVVAVHPGTTLTPLSEPFVRGRNPRPPRESAQHILSVVHGLGAGDSGKFFNWDGRELPW
jgi:NAD(P)-dependent dehydrogenase (short-subunit alcohol dehydrogenase family)